jgi:Right handed beta helix region
MDSAHSASASAVTEITSSVVIRSTSSAMKIFPLHVQWPIGVLLAMIAASLHPAFGFCCSAASLLGTGTLESVRVDNMRTYFVAVGGNDHGPGTKDQPWATINRAAEQVEAGDTVIVRGGRYMLPAQVRVRRSGRADAWISFIGAPGEKPLLDAQMVQRPLGALLNNGAFQIEGVSYIRVGNLTVVNSHDSGFTVRDGSNVDLINNTTNGTFSSGIAVWDTNHEGKTTKNIRVIGNTITKATTWDLAAPDVERLGEAPHEAISIGGAINFEVAYNHVYANDKEGIDIKETSKHGRVHHNLVHNQGRQGIYVDAWFGVISEIEIYSNVVRSCQGAGLVLSVENGESVENVNIHHNLIFNNDGSGLYFSRWGVDNTRRNIQISNNVFYHNGYGRPKGEQSYYWMTGGLYLYSTSIRDISIKNNIFSGNRGFQIGYSELFVRDGRSWLEVAREKDIQISANLINGDNTLGSPIESGGNPADQVNIYAIDGDGAIFGDPLFRDPAHEDFTLGLASPAGRIGAGPYPEDTPPQFWWRHDFPPSLIR